MEKLVGELEARRRELERSLKDLDAKRAEHLARLDELDLFKTQLQRTLEPRQ
jgi:hypothetical protein